MIIWADSGIVLSSRKHGEKYKIVNIFTKSQGKASGMMTLSKRNNLSLFSDVCVEWSSKNSDSLGFWKVQNEKQNWIFAINNQTNILACQSICFVLDKVLPYGVCSQKLFEFISFLSSELHNFSKIEILNLYAYFEFLLLNNIGYGMELDRCCVCGKVEELHYMSPKTGHGASNVCASIHANKLFEIPQSWNFWKDNKIDNIISASRITKEDVRNSLNITGYFIEKNVMQYENYFRNSMMEMLAA